MKPAMGLTRKPADKSAPLTAKEVAQMLAAAARRRDIQKAAERLLPRNRFTDALGKIYAAPLTAAGAAAGLANVGLARLSGDPRAAISVRDNGIQFESGYFGAGERAFTLGNSVLHGPGSRSDDLNTRYDGEKTRANTAEHESGHTYQYQHPGFIPDYLRYLVRQMVTGQPNPYEQEADDFGEWKHQQKIERR